MIKKLFRGEENLGFAYFFYGLIIFIALRYLLAAPLLFFYDMSPNVFKIFMICIKSLTIFICLSLYYGIWKCSAKSDGLPRWAARISYGLFTAVILFIDGVVLQTMLM
jgi:hypothetical protein